METFSVQFLMSDVITNVTVVPTDTNTFDCTLNLMDYFEGGELTTSEDGPDATIKIAEDGTGKLIGESKITLGDQDLHNLAQSIKEQINR